MKTEQELKDALEDIFFDALTDKSNPPYYTDKVDPENDGRWQWKVYELCADELIKRGYGDVSEYKAEIERLKDETSNIRKETAKEILDMLYDMSIDKEILECCRIFDVNGVSLAKQICEKYGVEIEK